MDAPWHYHSTTDGGRSPAPSIDEAPLDLFFRPGVKLDAGSSAWPCRECGGSRGELARIRHDLQPLDIVLVQSGAVYGTDNFVDQGCAWARKRRFGLPSVAFRSSALMRGVGMRPSATLPNVGRTRTIRRSSGKAIRLDRSGYCQIEKLTNLAELPPSGFTLSCFPVKIERASAGWIRAVARNWRSEAEPHPRRIFHFQNDRVDSKAFACSA